MIRWHDVEIDRKNRVIRRGDVEVQFYAHIRRNRMFEVLCHLILGGPRNYKDLFELVYRDDEDGGPLNANIVMTWVCQLRPRLVPLGLSVEYQGKAKAWNRIISVVLLDLPASEAAE